MNRMKEREVTVRGEDDPTTEKCDGCRQVKTLHAFDDGQVSCK